MLFRKVPHEETAIEMAAVAPSSAIENVVSKFNHAVVTGDCFPMLGIIDSLGEYGFNLFGGGGVVFGAEAPMRARADFTALANSPVKFEIKYLDGIVEENRGFWLASLVEQPTQISYVSSILISTNASAELSRFMFFVDQPVR